MSLLAEVLQHVPQQQRLTQCAIVSSSWASAATLATVRVQVQLKEEAIPAFEAWLGQHAGQLLSLQAADPGHLRHSLQLPVGMFMNLQQLQLQRFKLQLASAGNASAQISAAGSGMGAVLLPSLLDLQLDDNEVRDTNSLLQLTQAPQLTSLTVKHINVLAAVFHSGSGSCFNTAAAVQEMAEVMPRLLQQLPRLTVLDIPGLPIPDAAGCELGAMLGLRHVSLTQARHMPTFDLQLLPSSVTELRVHGNAVHTNNPSLPLQMAQLTALLHLSLDSCAVPSVVLGSIPQLQKLTMEDCLLLTGNHDDDFGDFDAAGTETLLDVLPKPTALQALELKLDSLDTSGDVAPQRFSALTASSCLTELVISPPGCASLPRGAAQHMFPAGRQMPLLQHLSISPHVEDDTLDEDDCCIDTADLSSILACCSGLQWLEIERSDADLSVLLQLPEGCNSLLVGGIAFTDNAAPVLAQLTQLDYLCLHNSPEFTDAGLEQLMPLRLGRLYVYDCSLSVEVTSEGDPGTLDVTWSKEVSAALRRQLATYDANYVVCGTNVLTGANFVDVLS